jgi:GST-like protein
MEVQRLCDVLDKHLTTRSYLVGEEYSLADIMCYPWVRFLRIGYVHGSSKTSAASFLGLEEKYPNLMRWADLLSKRPAVIKGVQVNGWTSPHPKPWLVEEDKKEEAK